MKQPTFWDYTAPMPVPLDDLHAQLRAVQAERAMTRKRRFTRSRLDRHRAELEALAAAGASWQDLAQWLRTYRRIKVHPTTVGRRLAVWRARTPPGTVASE
ncbi:MAG: hypothetical protein AAF417_23305 [Pseudomonadota bacterium]